MNSLFVVALLFGLAVAEDDGQWKGEGLAESQDFGQYNGIYPGFVPYAYAPLAYARAWNYGAAPLAADGRVLDTPEVASAKAAFFAAYNAAAAGAGAPAPYAYYGYGAPVALTADGKFLQDTPEVAQAKAAHFAAKAAALNHVW